MPEVKVKVCGVLNNAQEVASLHPDFVGFIYYSKSPRYVGDDSTWVGNLNTRAAKVGVFVNQDVEVVNKRAEQDGLDLVQLHGTESVEYCSAIASKLKIMKVFSGEALPLQSELNAYTDEVDYFLFDNRSSGWGGSGHQFNWDELNGLEIPKPFFISGGVGPDDVEVLIQFSHKNFFGIDVNSRFEVEPGKKDIDKLKKFINQIQSKNAVSG